MYIVERSYLAEHRRAWVVVGIYPDSRYCEGHDLAAARRGTFRTRAAARAWVARYAGI
jgi:hypothetical protein